MPERITPFLAFEKVINKCRRKDQTEIEMENDQHQNCKRSDVQSIGTNSNASKSVSNAYSNQGDLIARLQAIQPRFLIFTHISMSQIKVTQTHLRRRQMSPGSHLMYLTSFRETAQNGVTLMRVNILLGEVNIVCRSILFF